MTVTIDRLGRIVVPKAVRTRYHLSPGTDLELEVDATGFHLRPAHEEPTLIEKDGLLVHHGTGTVDLDIPTLIDADRDHRAEHLVAEEPEE
jgi:AbrB family looped-hinge helix DNA binding protein